MIIELIFSAFAALVEGIVGLLPTTDAPTWLNDGAGYLNTVLGYGAGLAGWIPFELAGTIVTAVLACVVVGFLIKVVRIVASFLTAGGGSAA